MSPEAVAPKYKMPLRPFLRVVLIGSMSLALLYVISGLIWKYSGSNQWEFHSEKNGVKVYTLKQPGSELRQVKGITRVHSTVARLVDMVRDPSVCDDVGCTAARTLDRVSDQLQYDYFRLDRPPFKTREFVIKEDFHQDPRTKAVFMTVSAAPDAIPPDPCCFRVTQMSNSLQFTPVGNGEVEIEYVVSQNEGGFIPSLFLNRFRPKIMYNLQALQQLANREKYKNAKFDFMKEDETNGPETVTMR